LGSKQCAELLAELIPDPEKTPHRVRKRVKKLKLKRGDPEQSARIAKALRENQEGTANGPGNVRREL